ncbi:MAG: acyl-CoA thioesterase [Thermoleophilia bacterium]|nr:acyl-CoA thioesterase [Thermoleophilia bacterium]
MSTGTPQVRRETRRIVMSEIDVSQVHFTTAYAWMDRGLCEWLADRGWPFTRLIEEGVGIPVVDSRCRFDARILLDDIITIETTVGGVGSTSFRSRHRFLRGTELCAEGELVHVCIERAGRTPVRVPDWIREAATAA